MRTSQVGNDIVSRMGRPGDREGEKAGGGYKHELGPSVQMCEVRVGESDPG